MRSGAPRVWYAVLLLVLAASLSYAALAVACHPNATISLDPAQGPAGSTVTVTGRGFVGGETVQIAWNGARGAPMGSAVASPSGAFTTTVQIPQAPADTYTVVGYAPGTLAGGSVAAFTIPAPARSPEPQDSPSAPAPDAPRAPGAATQPPGTTGAVSGSTSGADTTSAGGSGRGATTRSAIGADRGPAVTRSGGATTRSGGATARSGGGASEAGVTRLPSGVSVFADSMTPSAAAAGTASRRTATAPGGEGAVPSARSAASDLWSGFASGRSPLTPGSESAPVQESATVPLLSLALLGVGLLAALAGVVAAATRRRHASARVS